MTTTFQQLIDSTIESAAAEVTDQVNATLAQSGMTPQEIAHMHETDESLQIRLHYQAIARAMQNASQLHGNLTRLVIYLLYEMETNKIYQSIREQESDSLEEWAKQNITEMDWGYLSRLINSVKRMIIPITDRNIEVVAVNPRTGEVETDDDGNTIMIPVTPETLMEHASIKTLKELPYVMSTMTEADQSHMMGYVMNGYSHSEVMRQARIITETSNANPDDDDTVPTLRFRSVDGGYELSGFISSAHLTLLQSVLGDDIHFEFDEGVSA